MFVFAMLLFLFCRGLALAEGDADSGPIEENNGEKIQGQGFDSIEGLINIMKQKGVINDDEAEKFIKQYRAQEEEPKKRGPVLVITPEEGNEKYFEDIAREANEAIEKDVEQVKGQVDQNMDELLRRSRLAERRIDDLEEKVATDVGGALQKLSWAKKIRWGGDVRIRYHGQYFDKDNGLAADFTDYTVINTQKDRHRMRYRVRLAANAKITEGKETEIGSVDMGIRISTGNEDNPVSNNDTFGDYSGGDGIVFDRAFLKWTYQPQEPVWFDNIPEVSITAGRIPNPWFYTNLIWDHDLNFEGVAVNFKSDTQMKNPWSTFMTVGAFPIEELEWGADDKWLYGGQVGVSYQKTMGVSWKLGAAYYDYHNIVGNENQTDEGDIADSQPLFVQHGNTLYDVNPNLSSSGIWAALASEYQELNITAMVDIDYWFPVHITLLGDYVKNLGYDKDDVSDRVGYEVDEETEAYHVKLSVGYPKMRGFGEWNWSMAYKYVERDAVLDAFADSDMHLGGANYKGWIMGLQYGLYKNLWLQARWFSSDAISETINPLGYSAEPMSVDVFLLDINARY